MAEGSSLQVNQGYDTVIKRYNHALASAIEVCDPLSKFSVRTGFCGDNGSGKSIDALGYCQNSAMEISKILRQGDPDYWPEYFPYWENMAIILEDEMQKVARKVAPMQVKFYDEIQEEIASNLLFYSKGNKAFNKEFRIKRPLKNVIAATLPELFMQDKGSRHLYTALVEQIGNMRAHKYGLGFCKLKIVSLQALEESNRLRKYYPVINGVIYPISGYLHCDQKLKDTYEKRREENQKISEDREYEASKREKEVMKAREDRILNGSKNKFTAIQDILIDHPDLSGGQVAGMLRKQGIEVSASYVNQCKEKLGFNA